MIDFALMLHVKLPVVDRIQPQSTCNKFATCIGVENEGTGVSKLNDSLAVNYNTFIAAWI